jgi:hypothetical protein
MHEDHAGQAKIADFLTTFALDQLRWSRTMLIRHPRMYFADALSYSAAVGNGAPLRMDVAAAGRSRSRLTSRRTSAEASPSSAR